MEYPVAIERGDADHAWGVIVPDVPGAFSAGDTMAEALTNAREAIVLQLTELLDQGESLPEPSSLDELANDPELANYIWAVVTVPPDELDSTIERVNITLPRRVLKEIDRAALAAGKNRSAFLAEAGLAHANAAAAA
ncbi:MAG: type II toxin-antitoxin system HicB family antitoxin [Burkholderiaceae bacterium]